MRRAYGNLFWWIYWRCVCLIPGTVRAIATALALTAQSRYPCHAIVKSTIQRGQKLDTPVCDINRSFEGRKPPRTRRTTRHFADLFALFITRLSYPTDHRPYPRGRALPRSSAGECLHHGNLPGCRRGQPRTCVSRDSRTCAWLGLVQHFDSRTEPTQ